LMKAKIYAVLEGMRLSISSVRSVKSDIVAVVAVDSNGRNPYDARSAEDLFTVALREWVHPSDTLARGAPDDVDM
jgi:hypothetical protein